MTSNDYCPCCGRYVPEGRLFCTICAGDVEKREKEERQTELLLRMCSKPQKTSG